MRAKLSTIFFITFVVFAAALIWRVDQIMSEEKLVSVDLQSRAQMLAIVHSLETETQGLADLMGLSYPEIELGKKDFSAGKPYSKFQMVAKLLPPNQRQDRRDWQITSNYFQEKTAARNWALSYVGLVLKSIKESDVKSGSSNVYALMDPTRKPFLLLLVHANINGLSSWYAGLMNSSVFQGMIDRQKGQLSSVFVVNAQGQALAHTTPEYVGSLLTEDPIVNEAIKMSGGSGSGTFKDLKGEPIRGFYEQIGVSNLFAVITTPIRTLMKDRDRIRFQLAMMGFGFALVGIAFFVFVYKPEAPVAAPFSYHASVPTGPQSVNASKTGIRSEYVKVASALSHELKSPLTSILGHAQLAGHHLLEPKAKEHLDKIESEARAAREIIQKLLTFAGEDKVVLQKEGLENAVNKALKNIEGKVLSKGIKLEKNIQAVPPFTMATDLVVKAIESILVNSIEAMERAPKKELNVTLMPEGSRIFFSVSDTGEGISAKDLEKIFDPFFTTRASSQHVGLGLSMAMGILKECHGDLQVQSEIGKGTTVIVYFAPEEIVSSSSAAVMNPQAAALMVPSKSAPMPIDDELTQEIHPSPVETKPVDPVENGAASADELTIDLDSLLVDKSIERLIDDTDEDFLASRKVDDNLPLPPVPVPVFMDEETVDLGTFQQSGQTSKVDRPKIDFKRKTTKLDEFKVAVRKPRGEL